MSKDEGLSFWDHLDVLRAIIIRIIVVTVLCGIVAFLFKDEPCTDRSQYIAKGMTEESAREAFRRGAEIVLANEKAGKPFTETESEIKALSEEMGVKINGIFQPIRVAITASTVSLPLHDSISLLGIDETERRIRRAIEFLCQEEK